MESPSNSIKKIMMSIKHKLSQISFSSRSFPSSKRTHPEYCKKQSLHKKLFLFLFVKLEPIELSLVSTQMK